MKSTDAELIAYINDTPELFNLLYDLNLLSDRVEPGTEKYIPILLIAAAWKMNRPKPRKKRTTNETFLQQSQ